MSDSLVLTKCDIKKAWSHSGAHWWRSTGRSLLSQRWADYQLWNNSMPRSAFSPNLWSCVCPHIPRITSLQRWLDVEILFVIPFEPCTQWQKWQCLVLRFQHVLLLTCPTGRCVCVCLAPLLSTAGMAQTLSFMNVVTLRGPRPFLNLQTFPLFWQKSAPPARTGIAFVAWQR